MNKFVVMLDPRDPVRLVAGLIFELLGFLARVDRTPGEKSKTKLF